MPRSPDTNGYKISVGELRHLVQWQTPNPTRDSTGQPIPNWTNLAQRYARVVALKSQEKLNELPQGQTMFCVTQRYLSTLDMTCRMVMNGVSYKITGLINVDNRNMYQDVYVTNTGTTP